MTNFDQNEQWERVNRRIDSLTDDDLKSFKRNDKAFNFATWAPSRFGVYYLKTMLTLMARALPEADLQLLDQVHNRTYGDPIFVRVKGREICLDYLQALHEAKYVGDVGRNVKRMVEIGAGYGRTCHTLLSLNPNVEEYVIIDLPGCLNLSRRYLKQVLEPQVYAKIKFVLNTECLDYFNEAPTVPTLALNCDSLGEMDKNVSRAYLDLIAQHADYFYSCNPIAKYDPICFEERDVNPEIIKDALSAGLLTSVIDVFDDDVVECHVDTYLEVMKPQASWSVMKHDLAELYSYYYHVIYSCPK